MFQTAAAFVLTLAVGLSLGMLGSGGSIVMLPVLVYVAGIEPHSAVAMSLAVVGGTSAVGAYLRYRQGHFHVQATLYFSLGGIVGAFFGSRLTHLVDHQVLMLLFSGLMVAVAVAMLRGRKDMSQTQQCHPVRCLLIGLAIGVLTGFLGVGGGFVIVPALVLLAGIETNKAVGASLAIIAINSASGFVGHVWQMGLDWQQTLLLLSLAVVGMFVGTSVSSRVPEKKLANLFASFVLAVGFVIAAIQVYGLLRPAP
jgi:uncharacterized membrane protein YfcA